MSYRSDLDAAHSRIHALEQENATLTKKQPQRPRKETSVRCPQCKGRFYRIGLALFGAIAGLILAGGLCWFLYTVITEHGDGNCYVKGEGLIFKLRREVRWGSDRPVGEYRSMQEALDDAAKIKCAVK